MDATAAPTCKAENATISAISLARAAKFGGRGVSIVSIAGSQERAAVENATGVSTVSGMALVQQKQFNMKKL